MTIENVKYIITQQWENLGYSGRQPDWLQREKNKYPIHPALIQAMDKHFDKLAIAKGKRRWEDTGYLDFKAMIDSIIPEWPHVSVTDPTQIGYTRSPQHGEADRQTYCKLGSYLTKHLPELLGSEIETIVTKFVHANELHFRIVTDRELIDAIFHTAAHSCMHPCHGESDEGWNKKNHPYNAYSSRTGWGMAIREDGEGMGRARSIIRLAEKEFVRIYGANEGDDHSTRGDDPPLRDWLMGQGYKLVTDFAGYKVERIQSKKNKSRLIGPYIDGSTKMCKFDKTDPQSLIVCREGNWAMNRTDGHLNMLFEDREGMVRCSDGEWCLPEDAQVCHGGSTLRRSICVLVPRHNEWFMRARAVEIDGIWEATMDLVEVNHFDRSTSHVLNTTPTVTVSITPDRSVNALVPECDVDYKGNYSFKQSLVVIGAGKFAGQKAKREDAVIREKDDAIMLRAHAGHTKLRFTEADWVLAVGDRVFLKEEACRRYGYNIISHNPLETPGTITETGRNSSMTCRAAWDNGTQNAYAGKDCFTLIETKAQFDKRIRAEREAQHV